MDSRQLKLIEDTIKVTGINEDGHQAFERGKKQHLFTINFSVEDQGCH